MGFRKLGQIGRMLDQAASGDLADGPPGLSGADELSIVASKVSLLGQRLRGAQVEVSDLRGNIDRLLRDLEDAVFVFNRELRLIFASGSVEKFLGGQRAWFSGQALADVFPPSTPLGLLIEQTARTGSPVHNRRVTAAGSRRCRMARAPWRCFPSTSWNGCPAPWAPARASWCGSRDPEAQRKIGRQLQTADRLAAIGRITGGVAHEVKNPLNAILLHVEVARAKMARGDNDVAPQMEIISREIVRLDRVVKTFLDFTRPVDLSFANVPLRELMDEIAQLARPQAEAPNIRVEVSLEDDGVVVRADRDLFKQAILNIVVNAIEAMPDGGGCAWKPSPRRCRRTAHFRHRRRHPAGAAGEDLPSLLHHQKRRVRHRPGHDVPDRPTSRWYNRIHQRTGERRYFSHSPSPCGVT